MFKLKIRVITLTEFVLIAEIHKLKIPCSLEFRSTNFNYYLYPYDITERISFLKSKLKDVDNYFKNYHKNRIINDQVILKDGNSKTFIITEIKEVDDSIEKKPFGYLNNFFSHILNILNLFFTTVFNIKRISIFRKQSNVIILRRVIESNPEFELESQRGNELLENTDVRYFEPFIPSILESLSDKSDFTEVFDEYINGKLVKRIEYKIVYLWNTLEHISDRYLSIKKKHRILEDDKFEELKELVSIKMNDLDQSDLVFSKNLEEAKEIIISKMNNYPRIVDKILLMFNDYNIFSSDVEIIIKKVYFLRNRIFHNGIYLPLLLEKFENKYSESVPFRINDLKELINRFEFLINLILVNIFNLTHIFDVKENNKMIWKQRFPDDNTYFNYKLTAEDGRIFEQVSELTHSHFPDSDQLKAYILKTLEYLNRKKKWFKLLRFWKKKLEYWIKFMSLSYKPSFIENSNEKLLLKSKNDKEAYFSISSKTKFIEDYKDSLKNRNSRKNSFFTTYIYLINSGTIQLQLELVKIVESLEFMGETKGEVHYIQIDYGRSDSKTFNYKGLDRKGRCEKCNHRINEVNIVDPTLFGRFFPMLSSYLCKNCKYFTFREIFIYPIISEQFVQIPIHIMHDNKILRRGNGFFYSRIQDVKSHLFFITTHKILTGSFPGENTPNSGISAKLLFHTSWDDVEKKMEIEIPLYTNDNNPIWIQSENKNHDYAIIPIFPLIHKHCKVCALNEKNTIIPLEITNNLLLSVIGFTEGIFNDGIPQMFGFHSTKDEFLNLKKKEYVSIQSYNGMEGSPVFIIINNYEEKKIRVLFIGLYSDFQNGGILKSDLIIDEINRIDFKKYFLEIIKKLPYTHKTHLK